MHNFSFNQEGLIPAIIQDSKTGEVLMMAYMDREALQATLTTGKTHFFSRSRQRQWLKGETSGHWQHLKEMLTDCDQDCLVIKVEQEGGACHLGYRSCFVQRVDRTGNLSGATQPKVFDPKSVYKQGQTD